MPVCLKCGKEVGPGEEYCAECGASDDENVDRLLALAELDTYRPRRNRRPRWMTFSLLGLAVILVATAVGLLFSIPTGEEFQDRVQASVCRANLRDLEASIARYYVADGKYPPDGRVGAGHPLVTDHYFESPPKCPATGRYYILESGPAAPNAVCDSGLPGHNL